MKRYIKIKSAIIVYILVFILTLGSTLAISNWASGNTLLSGSTMCFDIEYSKGNDINLTNMVASTSFVSSNAASTTLSFSRKTSCELYGKGKITANITTNSSVNLASGGLRYKVIKNGSSQEVASGSISKTGENVIYDDFYILDMVDIYTVYFWLDANYIDNSYLEASFSGTVESSAISSTNYPGHIDSDIPTTNSLLVNFYYYNNDKVDYVSETCVGTGNTCIVTIPEEVSNSTGVYGNSFLGVSGSVGNMTSVSNEKVEVSENSSFYAIYSTEIDYKYYDTKWNTKKVYRNSYINSANELITVLSNSNSSVSSADISSGSSSANLLGYTSGTNAVVDYANISAITNSSVGSIAEVYQIGVSYTKDSGVSSIGKTSDSCSFTSPSVGCAITMPSISVLDDYRVLGWYDSTNQKVANQNESITITKNNQTYMAKSADSGVPVCSITTTSTLKSDKQTATLSCTDNIGVVKYYFGTDANGVANVEISSTPNMNITKEISGKGTYYLKAEDANGNISSVVSQTYYSYSFDNYLLNVTGSKGTYNTSNYTKVNTNSYIAPKDSTITISNVYTTPTGGVYANGTNSSGSAITSAILSADSTYNIWFNRIEYTITVATTTGGSNKVTTQNNTTGVTATSSSENKSITIRYGEQLTGVATSSTGYRFSSFSGVLTSTNSTMTSTPNKSGTLTANFSPNSYTISYSLNGGTNSSSALTTANYDSVINIPNPTKSGWTFIGWTISGNNTSTSMYGTTSNNVSTNWSNASTKVTAGYFKNLASTNGATVTMTAHFQKEMIGTFYYYNGSSQTSKTSSCMLYDTDTLCTFSLPSEISNSTGLDGATYYGVSTTKSSSTITTTYNSNTLSYYVVYRGSWTATYNKDSTVSSIGSTSNSCINYKVSNGSSYNSTSCNVTLPSINVDSEHIVLGWYNSSNTKVGDSGSSISLSSNITYTAKARGLMATDLYYDNTNTGVDCDNVQCMIDEIDSILES